MSKYIIISGSPRKGNSEFVLSEIHKSLKGESELVVLRDLNLGYCRGCLACYKSGKCVQDDDMKKIFQKLLKADVIIIGSPLYYGNVSALMKNFIDRTIPAYESGLLKSKKLISVMVGGGKTEVTAKFHRQAIRGFVKYNQLQLLKMFNFSAFEANDLKSNPNTKKEIKKIIELATSNRP